MARFLALDWDHHQLNLVSASVKHGAVQIHHAISVKDVSGPAPASAEAVGRQLRERMQAAGIAAGPVLACIGRDRLILKELRFPAVPAAEEPAVVRFQVIKELSDQADDVVIDYTTVGESGATDERHGLALVLKRELLTAFQTLCNAAGLKLAGLTARPFGTISCLKNVAGTTERTPAADRADAAVAIVTVGDPWTELCVVRGEHLLFSRSLAAGSPLPAEIRRSLAVFAGQAAQEAVRALYIAGGREIASVRDKLQDVLGIPVDPFDPFDGLEGPDVPAETRGDFAAAIGLLYARAGKARLPINFVEPKQPKPPRDPNKKRLILAAAVAGILLIGGSVVAFAEISSQDQELADLDQKKQSLVKQLADLDDDAKRIKHLDEWSSHKIVWLDEIYDLTDRFPDTNTIRLTNLKCEQRNVTGKDKYVGKMTLTGIVNRTLRPVDELMVQLNKDGHLMVGAKDTKGNTSTDRARFPTQFTSQVDIEKLPPNQFERRLPEGSAEDKPERSNFRNRRPIRAPGDMGGNLP